VPAAMHEAALACGKLTRGGTGGQPTLPEVIMSKPHQLRGLQVVCY
jgi:hypothetical protein